VSADDIEAVKAAYPNFYADTGAFLDALNEKIADKEQPRVGEIHKSDGQLSEGSAQRNQSQVGSGEARKETNQHRTLQATRQSMQL
jgi:hypothetical protein